MLASFRIPRLARLLAATSAAFCLFVPPKLAQTPTTIRVSVASDGTQGTGVRSNQPSISADGRYVAFISGAPNLVTGDTNGLDDCFIRDTVVGTTKLVSMANDGTQGAGWSSDTSISADGRYVAFASNSTNLTPSATNGARHIFIRDTVAGTTKLVSASADGTQGNAGSYYPTISSEGRHIAFTSDASNLVAGDTNACGDVFRRDISAGTITRVSVTSDSSQANGGSSTASISADGRLVAFWSDASNLVTGDVNGKWDVFVRDTVAGTTKIVSVASDGTQGANESYLPSISADGRYVAFMSGAPNLVQGDTNDEWDVFVRDTANGTTRRVSVASDGTQGNGYSGIPSLSADGRYVAFYSYATNLVVSDTNGVQDIFVRDTASGTTTCASIGFDGALGNAASYSKAITADGRYVAFDSDASNLVPGDTNGVEDVFVRGPLWTNAASHLVYATQPDLAEAGKPFQQQPVVLARDAGNVLIADYNGPVTLAIKAGTGTPGAALTGTATVLAVNGVGTFTDLGVDRKGTGYVLEALVGPNKLGESAAFNVSPKADRLVFTVQPGGATDDWPFTSQPIVGVVDADGETASLNRGVITLAVKPGTGTPGATLRGIRIATALHGVAGFVGLNINKVGAGYVLTATSPGLTSADSAVFDVIEAPKLLLRQNSADEIEVSMRPAGATIIGATVALSWNASELAPVQAADIHPAAGWTVDSSGNAPDLTVTLSSPGTTANGPVLTLHLTAQSGFAGRSTAVALTDASDLTDDGYNPIPVLPRTIAYIPGARLAFTRQPVLTTAGEIIAGQPTVSMLDGTSAVVSDFTEPVTMAIKPGTGAPSAILGGTTAVSATAGVSAFNNLTIDRKGIGYVLVASNGPFSTESLAFDIAPKALKLAFTAQPGNARAGLPLAPQPVVAVQDDEGATASAFTGPIALAIKAGTGFPGATLAGTATLNAIAGVASFTDVRIGTAAPGYVLTASGQSLTGAESLAFDVTPFLFTTADVRDSLRWAAGISILPPGYLTRYDVVANSRVDLSDATRILRKTVGLEANP